MSGYFSLKSLKRSVKRCVASTGGALSVIRPKSGFRQTRDIMDRRLHLYGALEHLPAQAREPAGPRQAIHQLHVECRLQRSKTPTYRRMVNFQVASSAR
ncbi:hypothetical protein RGCCGE502_30618 (plasmid) [Rhizobium grahamii CCGE 502]|uniref:Uncharacterized protein n=1 Tax=Rhizobium grahamii CCGE 502 TaxID=990285 RepID=S3H7P9_9HYPH|nr:hypothetical protein RGCCGE502_30618 [Rhizobium grahamii CCGE 502]